MSSRSTGRLTGQTDQTREEPTMAEVVANTSMSLDGFILDTPTVVEGHGVTHLTYRVRREG